MGISPDFFARLPMGTLSDIPVQRGVVRAASPLGSMQPDRFDAGFKRYVYRGTGFDTLTPHLDEDWERGKGAPMPESKRVKKRRARTRKPKPRPAYRPRFYPYYGPEHVLEPPPDYEPEPDPFDSIEVEISTLPTGNRPAPGWQPTLGADIDAWMDEYDI